MGMRVESMKMHKCGPGLISAMIGVAKAGGIVSRMLITGLFHLINTVHMYYLHKVHSTVNNKSREGEDKYTDCPIESIEVYRPSFIDHRAPLHYHPSSYGGL